ncbi:MAG: hypothetical protein ABL908_13660 [Hyphomicrobium sp.]
MDENQKPTLALRYSEAGRRATNIWFALGLAAIALPLLPIWSGGERCYRSGCLFGLLPVPLRYAVLITVGLYLCHYAKRISDSITRRDIMVSMDETGVTLFGKSPKRLRWDEIDALSERTGVVMLRVYEPGSRWISLFDRERLPIVWLWSDRSREDVRRVVIYYRPDLTDGFA